MGRAARKVRRVAILLDLSLVSSRRPFHGIEAYSRRYGPWRFCGLLARRGAASVPLDRWHGDGIIGAFTDRERAAEAVRSGLPAVDISGFLRSPGLAQVTVDNRAVGRLAAEHLLATGLRRFAFVKDAGWYAEQRCQGFRGRIREARFVCADGRVIDPAGDSLMPGLWPRSLVGWLRRLPKPVGIFAAHDWAAERLVLACQALGLRVPQDVAVVGADNDDALCEPALGSISSVDIPFDRIGYEAAVLLDGLMRGIVPPKGPILVAPRGVVRRASSDTFANMDAETARALRFIRENAHRPILVEDVLEQTSVSQATLQKRFRDAIGRTPHEEIQRTRLENAKRLLAETALPLSQVALACGFSSARHLCVVFRTKMDTTPAGYRSHCQVH